MATTIYLSSTYEDLHEYRRAVYELLRKSDHSVIAMEDYIATDQRSVDKCLKDVEQADIYVGLFAFRYGYVPPRHHQNPEGRSITELEFRRAEALKKHCLIFVVKDTTAWPRVFDDAYKSEDKGERINALRHYLLTEKTASLFSHPDELAGLVVTAITKYLSQKEHQASADAHVPARIEWHPDESPYPGLFSFDKHYSPLFFGRDLEVGELLAKMSRPDARFLIISGASGSGKSSLVAAGIWRALLRDGRLPGSEHWAWVRMQPGDEDSPFGSLTQGLKYQVWSQLPKPRDLARELTEGRTKIETVLDLCLTPGQELVLFIDQLEELFTQSVKDADIKHFLEHLVATTRGESSRLRVLATVRSEFTERLEESEGVLRILNAGHNYHLGPVSLKILQDMIERPAQATGYEFESGLIDEMLRDAAQEPGSLALVAYALKQLFERRRGRLFTRDAYKEINGIAGAIGTQADQVMDKLDEESRGAFDKVFAELVHPHRERPPTRKRATLADFASDKAATHLIDALAGPECRILVRGREGREAQVEVAHEKLFIAWPRLKEWIGTSGEALRLIDHATETARRWEDRGNKVEELWSGGGADVAEVLAAMHRFGKQTLPELERFLKPQSFLLKQLQDDVLSHADRVRIGIKLSEFGDTREGVGLTSAGLPDIRWVTIPPGRVRLDGIEHIFEVKSFRMAKYLVTNAQFGAFIRTEDSYGHADWWKDISNPYWRITPRTPRWPEANCPRMVSWYEAIAFCRWLSARTGTTIRLPAEWEWQQAATGGDPTRHYPWPGGWDAARCSHSSVYEDRITAVGMYPSGASQQGVLDMAGNVWEWCMNQSDQPERSWALHINSHNNRAIRGGSLYDKPEHLRTSHREGQTPTSQDHLIGVRLVQDIP